MRPPVPVVDDDGMNTTLRRRPLGVTRVAMVAAVGLAVGALTSVLQTYLNSPWLSLVNAASPWLTFAFLLGTLYRSPLEAACAGVATGLLELAGYYVTANARGHSAVGGIVVFWAACAFLGGPVFGAAGWACWRDRGHFGNLGAAVLPAAFLAEAAISYGVRLHYASSALLFAGLGALAFGILGLGRHRYLGIARWLVVTVPVAMLGELVLGLVYRQAF
jgi:hypothetical protein